MPFITIDSNASLKNNDAKQCAIRAAELVAEIMGKPLSYLVVKVNPEQDMCFEGNLDVKGVLARVEAIGFNDKAKLVRLLTEFLYDRFEDVELDTINIVLTDMPAADVAKNGRLFG